MAKYQMSYGFVDPNQETVSKKAPEPVKVPEKMDKEQKKAEAKRKAAEPPTWFEIDEAHNTAVYISGLPLDITMDELTELVTKCGLIARDEKNKNKIKLYRDANGEPKGDALCTYIKVSTKNSCFSMDKFAGVCSEFCEPQNLLQSRCSILLCYLFLN